MLMGPATLVTSGPIFHRMIRPGSTCIIQSGPAWTACLTRLGAHCAHRGDAFHHSCYDGAAPSGLQGDAIPNDKRPCHKLHPAHQFVRLSIFGTDLGPRLQGGPVTLVINFDHHRLAYRLPAVPSWSLMHHPAHHLSPDAQTAQACPLTVHPALGGQTDLV